MDQTLRRMSVMAQQAATYLSRHHSWGDGARPLWWHLAPAQRIAALRSYLELHVHFVPDPPGEEYVREPLQMIDAASRFKQADGDCDDVATLAAAIALAAGLRVRWRVLGFTRGEPYMHVYAEVAPPSGGSWEELDTTRPYALPGLTLPAPVRSRTVEL